MPLEPGATLGHYEILSALGAGGMGEVYRARDGQLGREVALKLLREEVAADPERLARFEREARVLASLNHPNIATLHGFATAPLIDGGGRGASEGDSDTSFLVMELVEGDTLEDRIARGPLALEEALPIFVQIAEGLEAAHQRGVIHRDLKPANIKPGADGRPLKILDFGLAKATAPETEAADSASQSLSPTLTLAATRRGEIMGTAAYMSPEQAKGKAIDKRTDVWAFGACLFEALAGERAFQGSDASDTMASVLMMEPSWGSLPASTPAALRRLLRRCLEKDPRRRLRDVGDALIELEELRDTPTDEASAPSGVPSARRGAVLFGLAASALAAAALTALVLWGLRAESPRPVVRSVLTGSQSPPIRTEPFLSLLAISPDGSSVAYETEDGIYLRPVAELAGRKLTETGGRGPMFSPDGQWLAYFGMGENTLYKVPVRGGPSVAISRIAEGMPLWGSWGEDGTILFTVGNSGIDLYRVSSEGGDPESVDVTVPEGTVDIRWTEILPGAKAALVTLHDAPTRGRVRLAVVDLGSGELKPLLDDAGRAVLAPNGFLLYGRAGSLMAVPFDLEELEVRGTPMQVVDRVMTKRLSHGGDFAISRDGALVYASGSTVAVTQKTVVRWRDRKGTMTPTSLESASWSAPRFSPDGRRLALLRYLDDNSDVYVWDIDSDRLTRFTQATTTEIVPLWSRDGSALYYSSNRTGPWNIHRRSLHGTDDEELIWASEVSTTPGATTPDGTRLVYESMGATMLGGDIGVVSLVEGGSGVELLASEFQEIQPALSPDGRWLAYSSNRSGRQEIYVQPFPNVDDGRWQVSDSGGLLPRWGPDGRELLYRVPGSGALMRAPIDTDGEVRVGTPETIFVPSEQVGFLLGWDLHPDGERFVTIEAAAGEAESAPEVVLIQNFTAELEALFAED